jgi:hypothetical protein
VGRKNNRGSRRERRDPYFDLAFVKAASVGGLFHLSDAIISVVATKLPNVNVRSSVAVGGIPDMK